MSIVTCICLPQSLHTHVPTESSPILNLNSFTSNGYLMSHRIKRYHNWYWCMHSIHLKQTRQLVLKLFCHQSSIKRQIKVKKPKLTWYVQGQVFVECQNSGTIKLEHNITILSLPVLEHNSSINKVCTVNITTYPSGRLPTLSHVTRPLRLYKVAHVTKVGVTMTNQHTSTGHSSHVHTLHTAHSILLFLLLYIRQSFTLKW